MQERLTEVPLRVTVFTQDATLKNPIIVVVRQQKAVLSWELPIHVDDSNGGTTFPRISRTLCYDPWNNATDHLKNGYSVKRLMLEDPPIVSVATSSIDDVTVEVTVEPEDEFTIAPNQEYTVAVTPSEPKYFYYDFPDNATQTDNTQTVVLVVTSEDNVCMTVSIQNASVSIKIFIII